MTARTTLRRSTRKTIRLAVAWLAAFACLVAVAPPASANTGPVLDSFSCPGGAAPYETFWCSFSGHDTDSGSLYYYINWGDGSAIEHVPTTGTVPNYQTQSRSHSYPSSGTYQVQLLALDTQGGNNGSWWSQYVVVNTPPVLDYVNCPSTVAVNESFGCTFSGHDTDSGSLYYYVNWGDGSAIEHVPTTGTVPNYDTQTRYHTFSASGTYNVQVLALDTSGGNSGWWVSSVTANRPPILDSLSCSPASVQIGAQVTCTFTGHDQDSSGLYYYVDWGDGSGVEHVPTTGTVPNNQQQSRSHAYGAGGTYSIGVLALDTLGGNSGSWQYRTISVNAPAVLDSLDCPGPNIYVNQQVTCTFYGHDPDSSAVYYNVDWGDGSAVERVPASGTLANYQQQTRSHTYTTSGTYAASVRAVDSAGAASAWSSVTIGVNSPPVLDSASCTPTSILTGQQVSCTFSGHDTDSAGLYYYVNWGDGTAVEHVPTTGTVPNYQQQSRSHTFAGSGTFTVGVLALDTKGGNSGSWQQFTITVNAPPVLDSFSCNVAVFVELGQPVSCTFSGHDQDTGGLYYYVDWGDGSAIEHVPTTGTVPNNQQQTRSHTFATHGTYNVKVLALDTQGGNSGSWQTVTVLVDRAPVIDSFGCGLEMVGADRTVGCTFSGRDIDSTGLYYYVDWGDGTPLEHVPTTGTVPNSSVQTRTHTYAGGGTYNVRLLALDTYGLNSGWQTSVQSVSACTGATGDCATSAIGLTEESVVTTNSTGATKDMGEPICGLGTKSIWFTFTSAQAAHRVVFDTGGSTIATYASVYYGSRMNSLTGLDCSNGDWVGTTASRLEWLANPGVTYFIRVTGVDSGAGWITGRLRTARLMVFGDSIAAGYGNSTTQVFGYPDSPDAYGYKMGAALKMPASVVAISGACSGPRASGNCAKTVMADQLAMPQSLPTDIVITVGANDIKFAECIEAYLANDPADPCVTQLTGNVGSLKTNLRTIIQQLKSWGPVSPRIVLTKYFNPFPPALTATEDRNHACDMWFPAYMARGDDRALRDPATLDFRARAAVQQADADTYTVGVLKALNDGIQWAADQEQVRAAQLDFTGHDLCATVRGKAGPSWVYGPDWDDRIDFGVTHWRPDYHSRPMGPQCAANPDDPYQHNVHKDPTGPGEYWLHFRTWCMPHPTNAGQQAIADTLVWLF